MSVQIHRAAPILQVAAIEPCLAFWAAIGFTETVSVPHGDARGFSILERGGIRIMLQTLASLADDLPALAPSAPVAALLYLDVDDIDALAATLTDAEIVVPLRTTFYGAREIFARDPAGNLIGFAQHPPR